MLRPTGPIRQSNRQPSEFEALRHNERLLPATSVIIQSGSETRAVAITGEPKVPPADPDREVIWTVEVSAVRFDLSALLAKPAVASTTPLDSTNAVVYSMGSTLCMLARSTDPTSRFLFSADRAGTYSVAITVSSIDVEPWARRSDASTLPVAKLPAMSHVGALVATLAWPEGTPPANARPGADWVFSSGIPTGFDKVNLGHVFGAINVPRVLPESWLGLVVVVKVGGAVVERVYLPWLPFRTTVGWNSEFTTPRGRSVYVINATDDGTVRNIKLSLQREYTIQDKDALFVSGNNKPIKANTSFELRAWI